MTAPPPAPDPTTQNASAYVNLRQQDLLDEVVAAEVESALPEGVEMMSPHVALTLANTAAPATVEREFDQGAVDAGAAALAGGTWVIHPEQPIRVDGNGRLTHGLNNLLAIVAADVAAPVPIVYAYDAAPRPLTWRRPDTPA